MLDSPGQQLVVGWIPLPAWLVLVVVRVAQEEVGDCQVGVVGERLLVELYGLPVILRLVRLVGFLEVPRRPQLTDPRTAQRQPLPRPTQQCPVPRPVRKCQPLIR